MLDAVSTAVILRYLAYWCLSMFFNDEENSRRIFTGMGRWDYVFYTLAFRVLYEWWVFYYWWIAIALMRNERYTIYFISSITDIATCRVWEIALFAPCFKLLFQHIW